MGKSQSAPQVLFLETDKSFYMPGEKIRGVVTLRTDHTMQASVLIVYLKRREKMQMEIYPICGLQANQAFYRVKSASVVSSFHPGARQPGTYQYPFEFEVPRKCMNSFVFGKSRGQCRYAYLRYSMVAKIEYGGLKQAKCLSAIDILQRPAPLPPPTSTEPPGTCTECKKAFPFALRVQLDRAAYPFGATAACSVSFDQSRVRMVLGKLTLYRQLVASSGAIGFSSKSRIGGSRRFAHKSYKREEAAAVVLHFPIIEKQVCTTPSVESHLLHCEYVFELRVVASACCDKVRQLAKVSVVLYDPRVDLDQYAI